MADQPRSAETPPATANPALTPGCQRAQHPESWLIKIIYEEAAGSPRYSRNRV
jgi:hypothetical protein